MDETNRTASFFSGLISEAAPAESSLVLSLFDGASKKACFEHFQSRLQASPDSIDLDTLRLCIRLLPQGDEDPSSISRLRELVVNAIPKEAANPERLYKLAELCLSNAQFGSQIFQHVLVYLQALDAVLSPNLDEIDYHASSVSMDQRFPNAVAYLGFLKCSYWLPAEYCHYVSPNVVQALCNLTGLDGMDDAAHDTLSALLSLLRKPIRALAYPDQSRHASGATPEAVHLTVDETIIGQQLWNRYRELPEDCFVPTGKVDEYFLSTSKAYRTWFQWVSLAAEHNIEVQGVYEELYWARVRAGLRNGFGEQRKYCLGIMLQSLKIAQHDIELPFIRLQVDQRAAYLQQYEKYNFLFETIVLDRYQNQIQACLPELTQLLGGKSLLTPTWITTMLSSVLDSRIQEGVRKLVGNWYIDFIIQESDRAFKDSEQKRAFFENNALFLTEGFLPWAAQGPMFTATLTVTRDHTTCLHGERVASVITRFLEASSAEVQRTIFVNICRFVLDCDGRLFSYSIVYLLQGLLDAFKQQMPPASLDKDDVSLLLRIARLPGFEKIGGDLIAALCSNLYSIINTTWQNAGLAQEVPGYDHLKARIEELQSGMDASESEGFSKLNENGEKEFLPSLLKELDTTQHKCIKDDAFLPVSRQLLRYLESQCQEGRGTVPYSEICAILEALWEEADRQLFRRPIVMSLPAVFFHTAVINTCIAQGKDGSGNDDLKALLAKAMRTLQQMADGKPYLLATLTHALRRAVFDCPEILTVLPFEEFLLRFIQSPPVPKKEFLFEVAAADKLVQHFPGRTYTSYYGQREWHAYAAVVDILNRFPHSHLDVARSILEELIEPWRSQKKPVPIISKWKHTFQLQAMLILCENCINDAEWYLESFMSALNVEQWPRYRYLLEWIVSRIYYRFPKLADRILPDLASLDDTSPIQTASLMKLAVLAAPFLKSEKFTTELMTLLIPFSASPKVHVRHEAHWAFPIVWDVAMENNYRSVIDNPAFDALNKHIRSLDKFSKPAWTIRTLKLDAVKDFTLVGIFEGEYLTIETPERNLVARADFWQIWDDLTPPRWPRVPLGASKSQSAAAAAADLTDTIGDLSIAPHTKFEPESASTPAPLQTKSGFDFSSLLPVSGPPSARQPRPASVILVASLIDNPTNLGGLSRIAESFGLEALTIDSLRHLEAKDFKATAVTSHKHQPILEVRLADVPEYLIKMKRKGWGVVGVEQTDRSGILGEGELKEGDKGINGKGGLGTLPEKCVLVLGSEKGGVSKEVLAVVDRCVEIRTVGVTRSLNVQTAGGIACFEWWREWGKKA